MNNSFSFVLQALLLRVVSSPKTRGRTDCGHRNTWEAPVVMTTARDFIYRVIDFVVWSPSVLFRKFDRWRLARARMKARQLSENPLVSVVIATRSDRVDLLSRRSLPSVVGQTHQVFEVLVVTDGPARAVDDAVKSFDTRFKRLIVHGCRQARRVGRRPIDQWYSGPSRALNHGLHHSRGELIALLDDDDTWSPQHLTLMIDEIRRRKLEFVSSRVQLPSGAAKHDFALDDKYYGKNASQLPTERVGSLITWVYVAHLAFFRHSSQSWRKQHNRPHDLDFITRLGAAGVRMGYLSQVTAQVGLRPGNDSWGSEAFLAEYGRDVN